MILQALMEYYENLAEQGKLPRQGWCQAKVSYGINLSKSGDIKDIVWLKREETFKSGRGGIYRGYQTDFL